MDEPASTLDKYKDAFEQSSLPLRAGNRVESLIGGAATYARMYDAMKNALEGDKTKNFIYLLGWWIDDDLLLRPDAPGVSADPQSSLFALAKRASDANVEVRVMAWKNLFNVAQSKVVARINGLTNGAAILDDNNIFLQSHHQKLLVVNGKDGLVGFCGGIDIAKDRVQIVPLHKGSPFHDVHCRIDGPAADDLLDVFRQRWWASPRVTQLPKDKQKLRGAQTPPRKKPSGKQQVAVLRTFVTAKRCTMEASIGPSVLAAIRKAQRFIYFEDQYMVNAWAPNAGTLGEKERFAAVALGQQLPKLQHVTILIPHSSLSDLPRVWQTRKAFVDAIFTSMPNGAAEYRTYYNYTTASPEVRGQLPPPKLRVFFKYEPPEHQDRAPERRPHQYEASELGPGSYVHSKTWVIDDELAFIGSANCNRRGWMYDNEVVAAIFDHVATRDDKQYSFAQQLRIKLWAKHLRLGENDKNLEDGARAQDLWLEKRASDYVRLYDPQEVRLYNLQDHPDPSVLDPIPEEGTRGLSDIIGDPSPEPIPMCPNRPRPEAPAKVFRYTPDDVPLPPRWSSAMPELASALLYGDPDSDNSDVLDQLVVRDLPSEPERELWLALVPGSSEARGHHRAWYPPKNDDPDRPALVEPEFRARLDHAYRLLDAGVVRYIVVSGGAIDAQAPAYNEGRRGRAQLLSDHADEWKTSDEADGDTLEMRIIVDPFAMHSTSNVRNTDRLTVLLGLDRNVIVTTSGTFKQGWWFTNHPPIGSFDSKCKSQLGYTLGSFQQLSPGPRGDNVFGTGAADNPNLPKAAFPTEAIIHWSLSTAKLLADPAWA